MSLRSCGLQNGSVLALNFRLIACYPSVVALIRPCSPACSFFASPYFSATSCAPHCIFPVIYNGRTTFHPTRPLGRISNGSLWVRFLRWRIEYRWHWNERLLADTFGGNDPAAVSAS